MDGIDSDYPAPSVYCFGGKDDEERAPPRITDRLGEVVILDHIRDPQVLVIDCVVGSHERERGLVMKVGSLAAYDQMRLRQ
jgi:hypothetical protein